MPLRQPTLLVWALSCMPQIVEASFPCLVKTWVIPKKLHGKMDDVLEDGNVFF